MWPPLAIASGVNRDDGLDVGADSGRFPRPLVEEVDARGDSVSFTSKNEPEQRFSETIIVSRMMVDEHTELAETFNGIP